MSSYLPKRCYAVCTHQLNDGYRQLLLSDEREARTVKLGKGRRTFLVVLDKKINEDFKCKSRWSSGAGTAAVGAGIVAGLGISYGIMALATGALIVPGVGWLVTGVVALGVIAAGIWEMCQRPSCNDMIGYEESRWVQHHETVYFDSQNVQLKEKHLALVANAKLACKEGGVILPFLNKDLAEDAAKAIQINNNKEMNIIIVAGFTGGLLLGASPTVFAAGLFFASVPAGNYIINPYLLNPVTDKTSDIAASMQGKSDSYADIKNAHDPYKKPDYFSISKQSDASADKAVEVFKDLRANSTNKAHIERLDLAITMGERMETYSVKHNPIVEGVWNDARSGVFGEPTQQIFTNKAGDGRGKNTYKSYSDAIDHKSNTITKNRKNIAKTGGAGLLSLFGFPIISAYFGNEAIRMGADYYDRRSLGEDGVHAGDY